MREARRWVAAAWLALLLVAGLALYAPGLHTPRFGDDYHWFVDSPPGGPLYYFLHPGSMTNMYRPLQWVTTLAVQRRFDGATFPLHLLVLLGHCLLAWLVFLWMRAERFGPAGAAAGSLYLLASQANAMAVLNTDTVTQVSTALCGVGTLWLLRRHLEAGRAPAYALSVLLFALALLGKETGLSLLPMTVILLLLHPAPGSRLRRAATLALPYVAATALYFVLRAAAGVPSAQFGPGRYDLQIGPRVLVNSALLTATPFLPVSTADLWVAVGQRRLGLLLPMGLMTAAWVALVGAMALRSPRRRVLVAVAVLALLAGVPAVFTNKVSELHAYHLAPFVAVLVGEAFGGLAALKGRGRRLAGCALVAAVLMGNALAVRSKTEHFRRNGERAEVLLAALPAYVPRVPPGGVLLLVNPPDSRPEYSDFLVRGFNVLQGAQERIGKLGGRPGLRVEIRNGPVDVPADALALTLAGEADVVPYPAARDVP